jgi:signal transduction histidine kinase
MKTCEIPIIFLSALSEATDKVKAFQVGGVDYITKPFYFEEVLARVENQLALRRMQTELQQAKSEALRALAQEKELSRLKSEFVSMISHDFRTPLTSIQGFAELLQHGSDQLTGEIRNRYFQKIDGAIEQMLRLIDEVLLIGSIEAGKVQYQPTPLNLEKFCRDLVETLQLGMSTQHQIHFIATGECTQAQMDQTLLQQILNNLLSNAIKYSPKGGTIQFDLQCQDGTATFRIADQGIGIPLDNQQHLFTTFNRCSNVGEIKGTGLGLAIVKRCVETHQGQISMKSEIGLGTTFTVNLPMVP